MGQQIIRKCKYGGAQNEEILPQMELQKEIISELFKNLKQNYMVLNHMLLLQKVLRVQNMMEYLERKIQKKEDSVGLVQTMDIEKVILINEEGVKLYCGIISLGDPINIGLKTMNGSLIELSEYGYTLVNYEEQGI